MDKEDVVLTYNRILLSHQKEWNNAICCNMERFRDCHTELSDREAETSYNNPYMWNLKRCDTNELIYKTDSQT